MMILSRKLSVAMFALTVGLVITALPSESHAQVMTPITGHWRAPFPNGQKTVHFHPGQQVLPDGTVIGRFSLRGHFAGQIPFDRFGEYAFRMTGPGRAFVQVRYDDNGQIERDNEHICGNRITFFDAFGTSTYYDRN